MIDNTCLFCRIVAGTLDASIVYEDDLTMAFMDLRQPNAGHVLVVPKGHYRTLDRLPPAIAARLFQDVVLLTGAVRRVFVPDGINMWSSNGVAAGQEVPHVHLHIFPRFSGDGYLRVYPDTPRTASREELDGMAERLRTSMARTPGAR